VQKTNPKGTWYLYLFSSGLPLNEAVDIVGDQWPLAAEMGAALCQAFESGEKVAEVDQAPDEQADGSGRPSKDVPY
jgi:hypothetical protein